MPNPDTPEQATPRPEQHQATEQRVCPRCGSDDPTFRRWLPAAGKAAMRCPDPFHERFTHPVWVSENQERCLNPYCDGEGNIYGSGPHPLRERWVGTCSDPVHADQTPPPADEATQPELGNPCASGYAEASARFVDPETLKKGPPE